MNPVTVRVLGKGEDTLWYRFVDREDSFLYDTPLWHAALLKTFRNFRHHTIVGTTEGAIVSGLSLFETRSPLRGHTLTNAPFKFPGSAFFSNVIDVAPFIEDLLSLGRTLDVDTIELILHSDALSDILQGYGFQQTLHHFFPTIPLRQTYDDTFSHYKERFRTKIRRLKEAFENNTDYEFGSGLSLESLRELYSLLFLEAKKKHHNIPPPFDLFRTFRELAGGTGNVELFFLRYKKKMIAADIVCYHQNTAYYCWGAVDLGFEAISVGTYLLDRIIRSFYLTNRNVTSFDLGLTSPENKGLCLFKSRWGAVFSRPAAYTLRLRGRPSRPSRQTLRNNPLMQGLITYMPNSFLRFLSNHIYRYLV